MALNSAKEIIRKCLGDKGTYALKHIYLSVEDTLNGLRGLKGSLSLNDKYVVRQHQYAIKGKHVFFGYYDIQQVRNGKMLIHTIDSHAKSDTDSCEINWVDLCDDSIHHIANSRAWCWQQGARLRWHPNNQELVVFNNVSDNHFCTEVWNIESNSCVTRFPVALYDIDSTFSYGLSLNFARLQRLRPGYGYNSLPDATEPELSPDEGILHYNILTGETKQIISLRQLASEVDAPGASHYVNHISIAPSGAKFLFFHLWVKPGESIWHNRLCIAKLNGSYRYCSPSDWVVSHYAWKDDDTIVLTEGNLITGEVRYIVLNVAKWESKILDDRHLKKDGHPSWLLDGERFITDTYPSKNRIQDVFISDGCGYYEKIVSVYASPLWYGEKRCDLHPRITPDNEIITVDTSMNGERSILLMNVDLGEKTSKSRSDRFVFIGTDTDTAINKLLSAYNCNEFTNAEFIQPHNITNKAVKRVYSVMFDSRIGRRLEFSSVPWNRFHRIKIMEFSNNCTNYIVFAPATEINKHLNKRLLTDIRKSMPNVVLCLLLFDSLDSPLGKYTGWPRVKEYFSLFDKVVTFDSKDARENKLNWFLDPYPYSAVQEQEDITSDLCFVGYDKGRKQILEAIGSHLKANGVDGRLFIVNPGIAKERKEGFIHYLKDAMQYDALLKTECSANCILEVLCDGQNDSSLRFYEAVVNNKKLLTNNRNITTYPFYNPDYIKIFGNPGDIDYEWLKERVDVNYGYAGEFSLKHFLQHLIDCKNI